MAKFDNLYDHSFYYFIGVYAFQLFLACVLYLYLPNIIPLHTGLNSVDSYSKEKWFSLFVPCLMMFFSCMCKSDFIEQWFPQAIFSISLVKLFMLLLQILGLLASIRYFLALIMLALK